MKDDIDSIVYAVDGNELNREMAMVSMYSLVSSTRLHIPITLLVDDGMLNSRHLLMVDHINRMSWGGVKVGLMPNKSRFLFTCAARSQKNRLGKMTFARLMIPKLVSGKSCLYLDVDTLVTGNVIESLVNSLSSVDKDAVVAGVTDPFALGENGIKTNYVNAGVIVLDIGLCQEKFFSERTFFQVLMNCDNMGDQRAINETFKAAILPGELNFLMSFMKPADKEKVVNAYNLLYSTKFKTIDEAMDTAKILHYNGPDKPIDPTTGDLRKGPEYDKYDLAYHSLLKDVGLEKMGKSK